MTFDDATPITGLDQLVSYMLEQVKPPERWVVGTEHEKFGWWPARGAYPTYEDPAGIGAVLEALEARGWEATREGDAIISLYRDGARITLEPGGQFELSGAPLRRLLDTKAELHAHLDELREVSAPFGLVWAGFGAGPHGTAADMPHMPKARYGVMRRYLPTRGKLALHMMHSTATVQANYDFSDEADAMRKLRASLLVQPIMAAVFANSPFVDGVLRDDVVSWRSRIWLDTDNDRTRFSPRLLEADAGLIDYVEWALDVPMFFFTRGHSFIDCAGLTFRRFMVEGFQGHAATLGDFAMHLSTLFPEARLKQYLEVRAADMGRPEDVVALPAIHAGLLYDGEALDKVLALLGHVDHAAWWALREQVPFLGLKATLSGRTLQAWAMDVLDIAREGLGRWQPEAQDLFDHIIERVAQGRCPADDLREAWAGDVGALFQAFRIA
ncbi:MAG: glutamate--cysteine ligase [Myxococcales bacterium]|nr:glutamate--cysteine ligase [Myxococcales bacterium]